MDYEEFLDRKSQIGQSYGFDCDDIPEFLFPVQKHGVKWAIKKGRSALMFDCGLGKTPMQLTWAQKIHEHTNKPVLIATPLAVSSQTKREADKFGFAADVSQDGSVASAITITNFEQLHKFDKNDFSAMVVDEASILKSMSGQTRKQITRFMNKMKFRLLCTATAAPNDFIELGTLSEALGELSHSDMLRRFFRQLDDKGQKKELKLQSEAERLIEKDSNYYGKLAFRVAQTIGQWRLKNHGVDQFWKWIASWGMACRKPSDLGYSDEGFVLPPLNQRQHVISPMTRQPGRLFNMPAIGLGEEREERKRTIKERCELVAQLTDHGNASVVWCHTNQEGDLLEKIIPGARQIAGRTPDSEKVEIYEAFASGEIKKLVIKPKIGAWGLNWQHCNHVIRFASHSYEQAYQCDRRCWRFGQKNEVTVDVIATEGEVRVLENMNRKAKQADEMFESLVKNMTQAMTIKRTNDFTKKVEVPAWLSKTN